MDKQQAKDKIVASEKASMTALAGMRKAGNALLVNVPVNGFGVIRDHQAMRRQLEVAQSPSCPRSIVVKGGEG